PTRAEAQRSYGVRPAAMIATSHHTGTTNAMVAGPQIHAGNPPSPEKTACQATVCPNSQGLNLTALRRRADPNESRPPVSRDTTSPRTRLPRDARIGELSQSAK